MSQMAQRMINLVQKKPWIGFAILLFFGLSLVLFPMRGLTAPLAVEGIKKEIQKTIHARYPSARIEILNPLPNFSFHPAQVKWVSEPVSGQARIQFSGASAAQAKPILVNVAFRAWQTIPFALRRIYPKEELKAELFEMREVDVTQGSFRGQHAWLLPADTDFSRLEARVSILEGQSPLKSSLQWIPIVKQGQWISIELLAGGLSLTTLAMAQEPGQIGQQIRVITRDTKKELIGSVTLNGKVQVKL